jgi:hypothetical protein
MSVQVGDLQQTKARMMESSNYRALPNRSMSGPRRFEWPCRKMTLYVQQRVATE